MPIFSAQGASQSALPFIRPESAYTAVSFNASTAEPLTLSLDQSTAIYLMSSALCHVSLSGTATKNDFPVPPNVPVVVYAKETDNLSVIGNTTTGTLWVVKCTNK